MTMTDNEAMELGRKVGEARAEYEAAVVALDTAQDAKVLAGRAELEAFRLTVETSGRLRALLFETEGVPA